MYAHPKRKLLLLFAGVKQAKVGKQEEAKGELITNVDKKSSPFSLK